MRKLTFCTQFSLSLKVPFSCTPEERECWQAAVWASGRRPLFPLPPSPFLTALNIDSSITKWLLQLSQKTTAKKKAETLRGDKLKKKQKTKQNPGALVSLDRRTYNSNYDNLTVGLLELMLIRFSFSMRCFLDIPANLGFPK